MAKPGASWRVSARAATNAQGRFKPQLLRGLLGPIRTAVRAATTNGSADRLEFCFRLRSVDVLRPVRRLRQGPIAQQRPACLACPLMQASPWPVFRALDEPGTQCIPLHVPHHGVEVLVAFRWKRGMTQSYKTLSDSSIYAPVPLVVRGCWVGWPRVANHPGPPGPTSFSTWIHPATSADAAMP